MIDRRRLFLFGTLSTLVLSCSTPIVSVLEKNGAQRVGLTQIQRKPNKKGYNRLLSTLRRYIAGKRCGS